MTKLTDIIEMDIPACMDINGSIFPVMIKNDSNIYCPDFYNCIYRHERRGKNYCNFYTAQSIMLLGEDDENNE